MKRTAAQVWQRNSGGLLALVVAAVLLAGCGSGSSKAPAAQGSSTTTAAAGPSTTVHYTASVVAQAKVPSVAVFDTSTATTPSKSLPSPQPSGSPLIFLVQGSEGSRLHVLLPIRPNGSTGWIERNDVALSQHDYRIVVALGAHQITVYKGDAIFDQEPIGVGTKDTPTPGGTYYTKELYKPPNPNGPYGPYAYALSGYSDVLTDFEGGDGVIGIHGTNDPSAIGHDVSHGCIRMSNPGITKLAQTLPLGVPVQIEA
ncbi:MAG: L,D-transpeptidase family protein [Acidimicrobiia bacterium]|nr:L,D-transpeptidase family protein [Acidimicrobiia bacterium]